MEVCLIVYSKNPKETEQAGASFAKKLIPGDIVALVGDLGGGKTTFTKGLAFGIGIKDKITSPSFTISRIYKGKKNLAHFDFYRIDRPDRLLISELLDLAAGRDYVIVIEWAEKIEKFLPKHYRVGFEHAANNTRKITIHEK